MANGLIEFETLSGEEIKDLLAGKEIRQKKKTVKIAGRQTVPNVGEPYAEDVSKKAVDGDDKKNAEDADATSKDALSDKTNGDTQAQKTKKSSMTDKVKKAKSDGIKKVQQLKDAVQQKVSRQAEHKEQEKENMNDNQTK